ncbi:MAG: hypothetical protein ACW99Q_17395, partial [Candidatus Kariarchaeaceae archaeon]
MSALVYSNISVNVNNDNISFENWDISAYLSMITEVSGSYQIIVKWLSDDGTQVGYFGTDIEIITQTSLISPSTISNTIISQDISLEIDFQSVQNTTTLDGADVSYTSSWGEADSLVQSGTRTNYTAVVSTSPASEGPGTLTVNVLLFGYVNHSKTYNLLLLRDTNISAFANGTDFYYNDVVEISIVYENATADNITSAIAQVEGNNAAEQGDGSYLYFFNTTTKDPSSSTFQLNITATKLYHINKSVLLFLNLLTNPTDIILDDFLNIPNGSNYAVVSKDLSSGTDDAFTLFLRYNDTRHSNVIRDATLDHNGSSIASFTGNGSDQDYTNGSWIVEVNPDVGGIFETIMFSFSKDGFNPSFYYITLNISVTDFILDFQIDEPQNVSFGTFHTVTINITEPTFNSSIDGVTITVDPTVFLVNPLGSGLYNLTYFGATLDYIGDFSFLVQFSKVGFSDQNRLFNYSITKPSSPFNTHSILNNGSIVVSEWGDATYLNISFIDSTHGIFLQPLTPPVSNSSSDVLIEYVSSVNGFHLYRVTPLTTGYWIIDLFMDTGLPDYFNTNSSIFTVNASIRTTATVFTFINAPSGVATPQYQRFVDIGILWNDEERGDLKANGTFALDFVWQDNSLTWVEYLNNTDGVHYFRVNGLDMQTHSVDIIFNSSLFASDTAQFSINVAPLQTNELDVSILSGVLLDTTNQTKFGYTTYLVFNWTIQDNNLTIFNPDLVILYNDQILSESSYEIFGIAVLTNSSDFTTHVWISFYKSSDLALGYDIGMQKFDFRFSAFGMEPQSHIFEVFTDGYDLDVTVIFKDKLIPGSDFTITVQLVYSNESTFRVLNSTTSTLRLQIIPQNTLLGSPIEDLFEVEYNIYVEYKDGSREWLNSTGQTTGGESIFALTDTGNIAQILNINIGIPGGSDNANLVFDVDVDTLPLVEEIPDFPFEILFIAILITAIVITIVIFTMNRRRSGKQRKVRAVQQKLDDARDRLSLISNIYTILITSESGLPVYSIINSLYKNNPAISEIVSGLSVGIDSFLQSFQSDFMQQLGEQITN